MNESRVFLLHGFCEDHRIWAETLRHSAFPGRYQSVDLPGFGTASDRVSEAGGVDEMARNVHELANTEEKGPIILIGHSLGGYVALAFARLFPGSLRGLGLFHSTAKADSGERKAARLKTIEFIEKNGEAAYHRTLMPALFHPGTPAGLVDQAIEIAKSAHAPGMIAAIHAMRNREDRTDTLRSFSKPLLILGGKHDTLIPESSLMEQAALGSHVILEILENSAHMGLLEEPVRSAAILDSFIGICDKAG